MGPFYGISNALILIAQIGGTNLLLKYFGLAGLLYTLPVFCALSGFGMTIYPGFWMVAIFRMGERVFYSSVDRIGSTISLTPLPTKIRRSAKLCRNGVVNPLGAGVAALILLFAEYFGLRGVAVITILACIAWFLIVKKIEKSYQTTLTEAVRVHRFDIASDDIEESALQNMRDVAIHALQDKDPDAVRFGLRLLEDAKDEKLPEVALQHLDSDYPDIRVTVIRTIAELDDKDMAPHLAQRLEIEKDSEVLWQLLKALSIIEPASAISAANQFLKSPVPVVQSGAILVLLAAGDLDALIEASTRLKAMLYSPDPAMRAGATHALGAFKTGRLKKELQFLLEDNDEKVCINAILAVDERRDVELAEELVSKLGCGRVSYFASRTLVKLGTSAVTHLVKTIKQHSQFGHGYKSESVFRAAIKTLTMIPDEVVEEAIKEVNQSENIIARTILAKECAWRARHQPVSHNFQEDAHRFVLDEAKTINILKSAKTTNSLPDYVKFEISARQSLAERRFLHWFAVCTEPTEVMNLVPTVLSPNSSQASQYSRATALEALETLARDSNLKKSITALENQMTVASDEAVAQLSTMADSWLKSVLYTEFHGFKGGEKMDATHKAILLRGVELFRELPGETLLAIAELVEAREIIKGEKIFLEGDPPDGLYMVTSGTVDIINRDNSVIAELKKPSYFGELALIDESPRTAGAIGGTDGMLLFLEKETFRRITEDLPEVLQPIIRVVIKYYNDARKRYNDAHKRADELGEQVIRLEHQIAENVSAAR